MTTIKRRNVQAAASSTHDEVDDSSERRTRNDDDERDSDDDKETRLTLMEEVLLLGLKDREVKTLQTSRVVVVIFSPIFVYFRVIHRFGTIVFRQVFGVVF